MLFAAVVLLLVILAFGLRLSTLVPLSFLVAACVFVVKGMTSIGKINDIETYKDLPGGISDRSDCAHIGHGRFYYRYDTL